MLFKLFQTKSRVEVWLYDNTELKIEGRLIGFDEYMNCVLDEAEEVFVKKSQAADQQQCTRRPIGKMMMKGDNICLICKLEDEEAA
eukprot:CAMPEP_0170494084 /NCGR_PEP_ID=MMETSP0208-20121228/14439_1 /TAXON_ID=197538 /ORGANISM="Strombidium inclinatum, Strain S3" /LENGTH=85 /DNA_ID=CAMNT_0010770089 /DNA_START=232 /DNA_END=485 /DNA_ORIENTATION=-